jgi:tRNA U34 5-methylaminomethyl-2-thiouridine-forming methyltransferase MnmC
LQEVQNYHQQESKLNQLIITSDGSHTIYVPELDEHYHSVHGAIRESEYIFISNGFDYCHANPISILEIGFGTGLNSLLTAIRSNAGNRKVLYTTIEKYPLPAHVIKQLNYCQFAGEEWRDIFNMIHTSDWNKTVSVSKYFSINKIEDDLITCKLYGTYDLIYFDAFGPDKQPEMWTLDIISKIASITNRYGVFITYSAKGELKRNLRACGFEVSLLPGPPGKRQIIRAVKK